MLHSDTALFIPRYIKPAWLAIVSHNESELALIVGIQ